MGTKFVNIKIQVNIILIAMKNEGSGITLAKISLKFVWSSFECWSNHWFRTWMYPEIPPTIDIINCAQKTPMIAYVVAISRDDILYLAGKLFCINFVSEPEKMMRPWTDWVFLRLIPLRIRCSGLKGMVMPFKLIFPENVYKNGFGFSHSIFPVIVGTYSSEVMISAISWLTSLIFKLVSPSKLLVST